jgi:hypothetical protein
MSIVRALSLAAYALDVSQGIPLHPIIALGYHEGYIIIHEGTIR